MVSDYKWPTLSPAPAVEVENKRPEREETASPSAVQEKRQPVVSSSHVPAARITPPVNPPVNNAAPPRPPPDPTDDDEYDSDDASKTDLSSQTEPLIYRT